MKTIAVRLEDDVMELLTIVSQLESTTIVDQIRTAITVHLEKKVSNGDLAARAQAALDDIDREAEARKSAIGSLIGNLPKSTGTPARGRSRRSQSTEPQAQLVEHRPIGYLPALARQREGVVAP